MSDSPGIVINAIVQLNGLIPVVLAWRIVEMVVACGLGRFFSIWFRLTMIEVEIRSEALAWTIVEVVVHRVKATVGVVALAKILDALRLADGMVLASHMVGDEVDNHLQACLMGTFH